jgi:peptidoglycan/LPS O-acetylase OafA/YrhL
MNGGASAVQRHNFIGSLTGLRYVAAVAVVIGHGAPSLRDDWLAQLVAQISSIGMTLFFVLSGFVLWLNYAAGFQDRPLSVTLREFAIARFARLYPMYAVVVFVIVGWLTIRRGAGAPSLGFILTMTQAWFPVLDGAMLVAVVPPLEHLWSISVELFFYLLFPFACLLLTEVDRLRTRLLLSLLNLVVFAVTIYAFFRFGEPLLQIAAPSLTDHAMQWLTYYSPYLHVSQFLAGCIAGMIYTKLSGVPIGDRERRGVTALFWLSVAGLAVAPVALYFQPRLPIGSFWIELGIRLDEVVAFSVIMIAASRHGLARFLASRALILGGECSYSIYLLHPFLIRLAMVGKSETPPLPEFLFRLILFVAIATAVAAVTYAVIEVPSRSWIRRVFGTSAPREVLRTA